MEKDEVFPSEIADQVKNFHLALSELKKELTPLIENLPKLKNDLSKNPIEAASLELTVCETINSLYWMLLQTNGIDATLNSIGHELYRVEKYTDRLKLIQDKKTQPKLDKKIAQAFIRNALFDENKS